MRIVVAPDSFKECLPAREVAQAIAIGLRDAFPSAEIDQVPVSDGGEGFLDAVVSSRGGERITTRVSDPFGREIEAELGLLEDNETAIIELAQASGIVRIPESERDAVRASTFGTGEQIREAVARGSRRIFLGLGGSATTDGGAGILSALGVVLRDSKGAEVTRGGGALTELAEVDVSAVDPALYECSFVVAFDVNNPLTGLNGAAHVYAPQKGAGEEEVQLLDMALERFADVLEAQSGRDIRNLPGVGAAGGAAAGLLSLFETELRTGFEMVAEACELEGRIKESNLVITGEGQVSSQTAFGKAPVGVANLARKHGVPVILMAGSLERGYETIYEQGVTAVMCIVSGPASKEYRIENAAELLSEASSRVARLIQLGKGL